MSTTPTAEEREEENKAAEKFVRSNYLRHSREGLAGYRGFVTGSDWRKRQMLAGISEARELIQQGIDKAGRFDSEKPLIKALAILERLAEGGK